MRLIVALITFTFLASLASGWVDDGKGGRLYNLTDPMTIEDLRYQVKPGIDQLRENDSQIFAELGNAKNAISTPKSADTSAGGVHIANSQNISLNIITTSGNDQPVEVTNSSQVDGNIKFGENGTVSVITMHNGDSDQTAPTSGISMHNGNFDGADLNPGSFVSHSVNTSVVEEKDDSMSVVISPTVVVEPSDLVWMNLVVCTTEPRFQSLNGHTMWWAIMNNEAFASAADSIAVQKVYAAWNNGMTGLTDKGFPVGDPNFQPPK